MTLDYRRFLGRAEELVLPYLGGTGVDAPGRRLRVKGGWGLGARGWGLVSGQQPGREQRAGGDLGAESTPMGWWRFRVEGRVAKPLSRAETPALEDRPLVRGHMVGEWLVRDGATAELVSLLPVEQPPRFAPARARRWHGGELIFEALDFETDAEEAVRRAFEDGGGLEGISGVPATLRAAFAICLTMEEARRLGVAVAPVEARRDAAEIATKGAEGARAFLARLEATRAEERRQMEESRRMAELRERLAEARASREADRAARARREQSAIDRASDALEAAGAHLREARRLTDGSFEVRFTFLGMRFTSVVDEASLQVLDAGICLAGSDRLVTLESLPSVIREALDTDRLVFTRHD